jgi:hypothetical protein
MTRLTQSDGSGGRLPVGDPPDMIISFFFFFFNIIIIIFNLEKKGVGENWE